jgi:hypothetical protein
MADEPIKKLLIKLGISTQDWKVAINEIKSQLNAVNEAAKRDAAQQKATQKESIGLTQQQIADQKRLQAEAKVLQEVDRAKAVWQKQQQEAIRTTIQQRVLETTEVKKQQVIAQAAVKLEQEKLRLAQQQFSLQQRQTNEQQRQIKAQSGGGGGGILGGIGKFASAVSGGGMIGAIAGGALTGGLIGGGVVEILEKVGDLVHRLGGELLNTAGAAGQLHEQFIKLAFREGANPEELMNKLRVATRGLVDDTQLYRVANQFMSGSLKITAEQMVSLTGMTVALARSTARGPNSVEMAMNALSRAALTGNVRMLSMVTGIDKAQIQMRGLGTGISAVSKEQMQLSMIMDAMARRFAEVGTPMTTVKDLFAQIHNVQDAFIEDLSYSITHSKSFASAIQLVSTWLIKITPQLLDFASSLGEKLGTAISISRPMLKGLYDLVLSLSNVLINLITGLDKAGQALLNFGGNADKAQKHFTLFRGYVYAMTLVFDSLNMSARMAGESIKLLYEIMAHPTFSKEALESYRNEIDKIREDFEKDKKQAYTGVFGTKEEGQVDVGKAGPVHKPPPDMGLLRQQQQLRMQIAIDEAKQKLTIALQENDEEKAANKEKYDSGLEDLKTYLANEKDLNDAAHTIKLQQIEADKKAKIDQLNFEAKGYTDQQGNKVGGMDAVTYGLRLKKIASDAQNQIAAENRSNAKEDTALIKQKTDDDLATYREYVANVNNVLKEGVQQRIKEEEEEFKQGLLSADQYIKDRKDLIDEEARLVTEGFKQQLDAAVKNGKETEKIQEDINQAEITRKQQQTDFDIQQDSIRLQYMQRRYELATRPYQTQINIAQGDITGRSAGVLTAARQQLLGAAEAHLNDLMQQTPRKGSDDWLKLQEDIEKTTLEIQKLNLELIKSQNISRPLSSIFESLSGVTGLFPRSKILTQTSELFGSMGGASQDIAKSVDYNSAIMQQHALKVQESIDTNNPFENTGPTNIVSSLSQSFTNLFKKVDDGAGGFESLSDKMASFEGALTSIISGVMGVIKGVTSGKSGGAGALSGGMAGMQEGMMFGPMGGLIGGLGGAALGGIFGAKTKHLTEDIHKIQTQMQSIVTDMQAGTISLSQAIEDLRKERQQAIAMLSQNPKGGKGGGKGAKKGYTPSQAQAVIEQIDTQINALVSQQSVILENLSTSLMELSNPIQFQDYLQSLDQIIQKYQQFASAAQGNAQEVAAANQYLNDSLQQYVTTLSQQLNQAQQQAIQDALTLINLEYQRQQIINQEAQQEYDVLTQGVLTRQRTTAMTKGQEIGQLRYQRDMQLEQINEQISLQQYKVATEQQIFGLATTRIGLETQLLEAQEEQANYQILQVQALAQVVTALSSGMAGGQLSATITNLMSTGALPTEAGIMYTLLQELGLAGNVPTTATQGQYGITNWLSAIPATAASAASYVAGLDPNFPNLILAGQYAQAASDASQFVQQGEVEGFDMTGLVSWLQSQSQGASGTGTGAGGTPTPFPTPLPGGASGGDITAPVVVGEEGPEILMPPLKGTVLSNPIVSALNGMMGTSAPPATTSSTSDLVATHQTLLNITQQRASLEMTVISARQSQIQLEMKYMESLQDTLSAINTSTNSGPNLESMVNNLYVQRGRYGSGGFRRETP